MKVKFLFLLLFSLFLVIGCNPTSTDVNNADNESDQEDNSGSENDSGNKSNTASEEATITLWHIESGESEQAIENAVDRFEEANPGVTVEVSRQENDPYKSKLSVAMGGGNPPDVFHSWGGGWLEQFVKAGQVMEITNDIDKDIYVEAALSAATYEDKVYGAPISMGVVPVFYNKDIFNKYDINEPETFEELKQVVQTLESEGIIPFALANQSKWTGSFYLMYLAERMGGADLFSEAYNRNGRGFDDEAYVEAGKRLQELVEMNAFPEGVNGMNYDTGQSRQLLYSEKAAMMTMGNWLVNNVRDEMPEFEDKLGFFLFPSIDGGKGEKNHVVGGVSPVFSVSKTSKHPDIATELVKELASIETATYMANNAGDISAIIGVDYEDEYVQQISKVLENSEFMQTYYDQTLPPELAQVHLDTTQALFGLSMTPEEAMEKVEEKAKELLD